MCVSTKTHKHTHTNKLYHVHRHTPVSFKVNVVDVSANGLTEELVAQHNCVVFTTFTPVEELLRWNEFCRSQQTPISFIYCFVAGTAGTLFVDHGPGFIMRDADGKAPLVKMITEVSTRFAVSTHPLTRTHALTHTYPSACAATSARAHPRPQDGLRWHS
jgi:hypothetical protein